MLDYQSRKHARTERYHAEHGRKLITCLACSGSRHYDHDGSPPCGGCGGTGRVREPQHETVTPPLPWRERLARQTALRTARRAAGLH